MPAFSLDLRQRILDAALRGHATEQAVAGRFRVSRSFVQKIKRLHRVTGSIVLYLPRYSPEFNPTELCWAKVKARLRGVAARTREALRAAVAAALRGLGVEEVRRWVRHCGYRLTRTSS